MDINLMWVLKFGFFGLTLGPIIVFLGFMMQFVAIFYKSKAADTENEEKGK